MIISNIGDVKSFADDLNIQRSIVSGRVPLLVRSAEIKLLLDRFVLIKRTPLSYNTLYFVIFFALKVTYPDNDLLSITRSHVLVPNTFALFQHLGTKVPRKSGQGNFLCTNFLSKSQLSGKGSTVFEHSVYILTECKIVD